MTRLLELRERYNLSLREMAMGTKVSHSGLSLIERGERSARGTSLKNIASYFAVSTDYLLEESDTGFYVKVIPFNNVMEVSIEQLDALIEMKVCEEYVSSQGVIRIIEYLTPEALDYINGVGNKVQKELKPEERNPYWNMYIKLNQSDKDVVNSVIDALYKKQSKN